MKQILINLIKNALKFTHSGFIDIEVDYVQVPNRQLDIKVTDTGCGIDPDDIPMLFSRFGKLQRTASINSEGIGLGLNIVKQIADSYQGHVSVQSEGVGSGSSF